jgi:ABC-2 type transport system permease protein
LARSAAVIQNLIPFPIYILSGIAFPLTLLPTWVWPLSALVPLKYVGELLRSSTQSQVNAPAISSVAPLLVLTFAYTVLGFWLFARIERSVRLSGRISLGE